MQMTSEKAFIYLNDCQHSIMEPNSIISLEEWLAEPLSEQRRYYEWMAQQCSNPAMMPYWSDWSDYR